MAYFFLQTANANENQCGERIPSNDVLVVDLEEYADQQTLFQEKLHEQAGDLIIMTKVPVRVAMEGNRTLAINRASKSAAHIGCDLLVLVGDTLTEKFWEGKTTTTRYLMVHMGKRESP
jgi:hypothetical protein